MNKILIPLFLLLFITSTYSQNYFKGLVVEEDTSMNVTDAIVAIDGTALAQKTDANGAFNFNETIPEGDRVVTIEKEGYVTKYLLITVTPGNNIIMDNIQIEVTKDERKRRDKALKEQMKKEREEQKEKDKLLEKAKKEKEKRDKELAKQKRKLEKEKDNTIPQTPIENAPSDNDIEEVTSVQIKYGMKLDVTPEAIKNQKLYEFIQEWEGTNYLLGGETEVGIDCSSFTQRLYSSVYDKYIERTAQKQFDSELTNKFLGKEYLKEGDLIFFKGSGELKNAITHVGIYLQNGNFVHSTSYTKDNGLKGVKISNLDNSFWKKRFVAGGKRSKK